MEPKARSRLAVGLMLILLGLGLYLMRYFGSVGEALTLTLLGGLGVAGYLFTRAYPLLIAGGVLLGLGAGAFGEDRSWFAGDHTQLGLGLGFVLIYLVRLLYERRSHWWPLIPGGILILLGLEAWRSFRTFLFSSQGWPLILVILGVLIMLGAIGRRKRRTSE